MNLLADAVLVIHALIASFIVAGLGAIWVGHRLNRDWARNRRFRILHLAAIGFVALTSLIGAACPLTVLENWLRGGGVGGEGFIQHWLARLLYYDLPAWVFTMTYLLFASAVVLTWRLIPPRGKR